MNELENSQKSAQEQERQIGDEEINISKEIELIEKTMQKKKKLDLIPLDSKIKSTNLALNEKKTEFEEL